MMRRVSLPASTLAIVLLLPLASSGCSGDGCCFDETDIIGSVLLGGVPVSGANVRVIFDFFVVDTEVTAADGTFFFEDYPEDWDPFFVEAFYIDPVTLNQYEGVTPFFLTNQNGPTDVGDINLVLSFPATAGSANGATGDLDGDPVEDLVAAFPGVLAVRLSSGESRVLATARADEGAFGAVAIRDVDGDGLMDLAVNRLATGAVDVYAGDGRGGFVKR